MTEASIEQEIREKRLEAPRLTPELIDAAIESSVYHRLNNVLTICVITLINGFTVTGESACASPENYDKVIGENIAFANARQKIWALEGYLLKQHLFMDSK